MAELLPALLERNARKYSADPGVKWPEKGVTLSWAELNRRAGALAGYLKQRGIKRGDKVAVLISNRPEFVEAFFGILKAGAVVVPVNVKLTPAEVAYILDNSESTALLCEDELRVPAEQAAANWSRAGSGYELPEPACLAWLKHQSIGKSS